jgi:hypothetical protein
MNKLKISNILNEDSIKLILKYHINFIEFKDWYLKNLEKIKNSKNITTSEKIFKNYLLNSNENISKLILFYKMYKRRKLLLKLL